MGNHLACISIHSCDVLKAKQSNLIFVVHSAESRVLEFSGPTMQVAELMLEFPGFFVTELVYSINTAQSTNKAVPMSADKVLMTFNSKKPGVAYVLLPMNRMQKPAAAQEWDSWTQMVIKHLSIPMIKQQSKSRGHRASNKIAPVDEQDIIVKEDEAEQLAEEEEEEDIMKLVKEELSAVSSSYSRKHWAPKLETIIEV